MGDNYNSTLQKLFCFVQAQPMQRMLQIAARSAATLDKSRDTDSHEKRMLRAELMNDPRIAHMITSMRNLLGFDSDMLVATTKAPTSINTTQVASTTSP